MHDWSGSRIREDALKVVCPYCFAAIDSPCVAKVDGKPIEAFPAHTVRITAAKNAETSGGAA